MNKKLSRNKNNVLILMICLGLNCFVSSCKTDKKPNGPIPTESKDVTIPELKEEAPPIPKQETTTPKKMDKGEVIPAGWSEISQSEGIILDIKYADKDNFTKKKIYDCGRCFLRPEASSAIKDIQNELKNNFGYSLKVFDCFRPQPFQQRLWDAVPNADYVTPPTKGSMHSRGLAVDLTIVDENGDELEMGTPFDFFGEEAHQDFKGHSAEINKNRALLKSTMEKYGFKSIRTEWWHYSYQSKSYPLDPWVWECQ